MSGADIWSRRRRRRASTRPLRLAPLRDRVFDSKLLSIRYVPRLRTLHHPTTRAVRTPDDNGFKLMQTPGKRYFAVYVINFFRTENEIGTPILFIQYLTAEQ